jgi:hypothetical protein
MNPWHNVVKEEAAGQHSFDGAKPRISVTSRLVRSRTSRWMIGGR